MLSEEEEILIQKDREENPGCFYSTTMSQSCKSVNGESTCELIKKIFRQCPGKSKELISNRKEVTEDENGSTLDSDFLNREHIGMRNGMDSGSFFGFGDPFRQRQDDFEAQMNPFEFFRQEMLRPFESFFGGGFFGGDNAFEGIEREFERMPMHPPSSSGRPSNTPPPNPPHYSYHPSNDGAKSKDKNARAEDKRELFAGYKGHVDEI